MIRRKAKFWGGSEKQSVLELKWRQAADCSRGGFQPPETHNRRQWTAVYVGSLAARWWRPNTAAVGIGDVLDVVGKIPWHQTMQALLNEHGQLEIDAFQRPQPVNVLQHQCDCDLLIRRRLMYQSGCSVEHGTYAVSCFHSIVMCMLCDCRLARRLVYQTVRTSRLSSR